jgi:serine/threonine protein kinase/Tfp pilus assembly protein PilF
MTSSRWKRIQDLFHNALQHEPAARPPFLDDACGDDLDLRREVESLLEAHGRSGPVDDLAEQVIDPLLDRLGDGPSDGERVGPYRVIRPIASGGMGAVFLAERDDGQFQRRVALKFVRIGLGGEESLRRFAIERQILARLAHPNIASLLDGGVSPRGPYLAMEFVDGTPIDRYCDEERLSVDRRLELFCEVCDAVQYAHQNLVVHRDLKPGNIFVTREGRARLLDFGIAKLLADDPAQEATVATARWMTPEYASPEQVRGGAITTASDTYALGVLLYLLLTGRRPYRVEMRTPQEIERVICDTEPLRPSAAVLRPLDDKVDGGGKTPDATGRARATQPRQLQRRLAGDLDTIVLKALQKEPGRRYATAGEFAEDVRRHLRGLPVRARADTFGYRAAKFARRHRIGVAASAVILALLLGGVAATAWQARRAEREARVAATERDRARLEADKASQVSAFLIGLFEVSDPEEARGRALTAREILDQGARRIEGELTDQPLVQAQMMTVLGQVYRNSGSFEEADTLLQRALAIRRSSAAPEDLAETLNSLGLLRVEQGRFEAAESLLIEALSSYRVGLGEDHNLVAGVLNNLGTLYIHMGDLDRAGDHIGWSLGIQRRLGAESESFTQSLMNLGGIRQRQGDLEAADSLFGQALEIYRRTLEPDHPQIAAALNNLAGNRYRRQDYAGAEPLYRESLAIRLKVYGPDHPQTAQGLNNLAATLEKLGQLAPAESLYRETLAAKRKILGESHPSIAVTLNNLGLLLQARGDLDGAEELLTESLSMRRATLGNEHSAVANALDNLGTLYRARGDLERAESFTREALEMARRTRGPDHLAVAAAAMNLARTLQEQSRYSEAEPLLKDALRIRSASLPPAHRSIAEVQSELGACLLAQGRHAEAEPLLLSAFQTLESAGDAAREPASLAASRLADLYQGMGDPARAAEYRAR